MDFHEIWGMGHLCSTEDLIKFWQIWGLGLVHLLLGSSDNLAEVCTLLGSQHIVKGCLLNCDAELSMRLHVLRVCGANVFLPSAPNTCHPWTAWPRHHSKTSHSTCPFAIGLL